MICNAIDAALENNALLRRGYVIRVNRDPRKYIRAEVKHYRSSVRVKLTTAEGHARVVGCYKTVSMEVLR